MTAKLNATSRAMIQAAQKLADDVAKLHFSEPVASIYNPLRYAWKPQELYLRRYASSTKRIIFVGMNPGPFGMAQTGVPFGEVAAVKDFLQIQAPVLQPPDPHPKRPIDGFACTRSEVSGRRVWGAIAQHYGSADSFFTEHYIANYCPLVFMQASGKNHTPDKLPKAERATLFAVCDAHLRSVVKTLQAEWVIGIGKFAEDRIRAALDDDSKIRVARVLHPSPASPLANKGWAQAAQKTLIELGLCKP